MKRLLLAVILSIFMTSTANAKCAWVLWLRTDTLFFQDGKLPSENVRWELIGATPKHESCVAMLQSVYKTHKAGWLEGRNAEE